MSLSKLVILLVFFVSVVIPSAWLSHHVREAALLEEEYKEDVKSIYPMSGFGSTESLSVLPLSNWHTKNHTLKGEQGVAYLIKTDTNTILFDVGHNQDELSPSPIEHNMNILGVSIDDVDTVFLSHNHFDHVGGDKWLKQNSFSLGNEQIDLTDKNIFTPVAKTYPNAKPTLSKQPTVIATGVASTGTIPRQLFIGRIDEQALAINLKGKGIVLVVGCGHQTLQKIVERTQALFKEPIYGIVGDLHYPVPNGRFDIAGINVQKLLASGDSPFRPLTQEQIDKDIELLKSLNLGIMALGGHDSSDDVITDVADDFKSAYQHVEVGSWIYSGQNQTAAAQ